MNPDEIKSQLEKIKQENPKKYLELLTELQAIVSDLNDELREAKAKLKT